jgi:hypothetical protein
MKTSDTYVAEMLAVLERRGRQIEAACGSTTHALDDDILAKLDLGKRGAWYGVMMNVLTRRTEATFVCALVNKTSRTRSIPGIGEVGLEAGYPRTLFSLCGGDGKVDGGVE